MLIKVTKGQQRQRRLNIYHCYILVSAGCLLACKTFPIPTVPQTTVTADLGDREHPSVPIPTGPSIRRRNLVIAGTLRDASQHLPQLRETIQRIRQGFHLLRIVLYENDSMDNTADILRQWNETAFPGLVDLMAERRVRASRGRVQILARARNAILDRLRMYQDEGIYVLMMDMDEVNYHLNHLDECFHLPPGWGDCCANTYALYYDLFALRTMDDWMPCDVWSKEDCGHDTQEEHDVWIGGRHRHIPASSSPIQVHSCFGGAALYDYTQLASLTSLRYGFEIDRKLVCEHVLFHTAIRTQKKDFKMYIQPKFLNDGPPLAKGGTNLSNRIDALMEAQRSIRDAKLAKYYELVRDRDVLTLSS
jgi:Cryptococcal mannosyltransferase 1